MCSTGGGGSSERVVGRYLEGGIQQHGQVSLSTLGSTLGTVGDFQCRTVGRHLFWGVSTCGEAYSVPCSIIIHEAPSRASFVRRHTLPTKCPTIDYHWLQLLKWKPTCFALQIPRTSQQLRLLFSWSWCCIGDKLASFQREPFGQDPSHSCGGPGRRFALQESKKSDIIILQIAWLNKQRLGGTQF